MGRLLRRLHHSRLPTVGSLFTGSSNARGIGLMLAVLAPLLLAGAGYASQSSGDSVTLDLTGSAVGFISIAVFVFAYALVMLEEVIHMRKSKPVLVAAGIIWALIGLTYQNAAGEASDPAVAHELSLFAEHAVRHNILEYGELFLFLLAAMTYINTMEERRVFDALRVWLVSKGFSLRQIFWMTGLLAFFISPIADNLTTALLMGTVAMSVGAGNRKFMVLALINIVVGANAGGAFSPFGDITTLMVWQKGIIGFSGFFALFIPSLINWLVPAAIMSIVLGKDKPAPIQEQMKLLPGAFTVVFMFLGTIAMAVSFHSFLHLPPVLGMMTGLGCLKLFGWYMKRKAHKAHGKAHATHGEDGDEPATKRSDNPFEAMSHHGAEEEEFDIFKRLEKAEWDTLMFFYGVILCVGGLGTIGYLSMVSHFAYDGFGPTWANVGVGVLSAIVDNIPVMFAVLTMFPEMSHGQWLLVTLTAGVGGSLLSVGSAAGVALMGQARGIYTFGAHLKWSWAIGLGYAASIACHLWLNSGLMDRPIDQAKVAEAVETEDVEMDVKEKKHKREMKANTHDGEDAEHPPAAEGDEAH
jgi:NhaD family Na+/H+ antiporter